MGEKDNGTPWFFFLSCNAPRTPMQARDDDLALYAHVKAKRRRASRATQHRLDVSVGRLMARFGIWPFSWLCRSGMTVFALLRLCVATFYQGVRTRLHRLRSTMCIVTC